MEATNYDPAARSAALRRLAEATATATDHQALRLLLEQAAELMASAIDPGRLSAKQIAPPVLLALDGRCAAGKTTLAQRFQTLVRTLGWDVPVLHMDDFFLPPQLRHADRLAWPGGNVHFERFEAEVLRPLSQGRSAWYQPFDCGRQRLEPGRLVQPAPLILTEGVYALHPQLRPYYKRAGRVFFDISAEQQRQRLLRRCLDSVAIDDTAGRAKLARFISVWIPLEERYISQTGLESACALSLTAG